MKKRKLKKWVKDLLLIILIYLIGFGCIFAMCERAEQIDRSINNESNTWVDNN